MPAPALVLAFAFAFSVPVVAAAQAVEPGATVWLRELPCEPARYDSAALGALLQVELRALRLALKPFPASDAAAQAEAMAGGLALLTVRCADAPDDDAVELELDDLAAQARSARTLALSDIPIDQRPRALALAIGSSLEQSLSAALLHAEQPPDSALPSGTAALLRARLLHRLQSPVDADVATPAPASEQVPPGPAPGAVELAAMTRVFPSYSTGLLGVQGGAGLPLARSWTLDVDGEALAGQSELSDAVGTVGTMWLYWLSAGLGVSVHAGRSGDHPDLALGPRLRIGYALADAHSDRDGASADDDNGVLVAALLTATLRAPIGRDASMLFGADLGYTLVGIVFVGDQARLSGMAGVTLGLRAGVSL